MNGPQADESRSEAAIARMAALESEPLQAVGDTRGLSGTARAIRDVHDYRELFVLLVRRELKARYKDSALGFLWTLIRPLVTLVVYFVAIGKFLGAARAIDDFAIFVFTGLITWQLFSEILAGCTSSIIANAGLVKKVYLPREIFPLSVVGSALVTFVTQLLVLLAACAVLGRFPLGVRWVYFPLAVGVVVIWALAIGLVLAAVNVYLRDVQYLVEIALTVLFWASPIVYAWHFVANATNHLLVSLYLLNPVTNAVLGMQRAFWVAGTGQPMPDSLGLRLVVLLGIGLVLLWIGQQVFGRLQANFAQEL